MVSIVIETTNFTSEQVKQILEFVETVKTKPTSYPMPPDFPRDDEERALETRLDGRQPLAKCVGRDTNVEPEIAAKLFGAEPSVGNEPMKETHVTAAFKPFTDYKPE